MKLLSNAKISTKFLSLLLLLGILTLGMAFTGSHELSRMNASYGVLVDTKMPVATKLARVNRRALEMVYAGYRALVYDGNSAEAHAANGSEKEAYQAAIQMLDESRQMRPEIGQTLDGARIKLDKIHAAAQQAIALGIANRNDEARQVLLPADALVPALSDELVQVNDRNIADANAMAADLSAASGTISIVLMSVGVLGVAGGIALSVWISRVGITAPLDRLRQTMDSLAAGSTHLDVPGTDRGDEVGAMARTVLVFRDAAQAQEAAAVAKARADAEQKMVVDTLSESLNGLAQGDLTAEIRRDFPAEYLVVKSNFNAAITQLRTLIGAVMESTSSIRTGSSEIAQASEDLARRTEGNAASLEETSAAITQIDDRLKTTAEAATHTVERADGAIATVSGGREIADEAVAAMNRVSESAKGIDSVIEGLDKIAFQTRVLAMNAAVEAGRAGDAGRGFAVVADLVSALAMRSEEEAKRAREQLTATQTDIVTAVDAVTKVDGALADISEGVGQVHALLGKMAEANQAQSSAITQISTALGTMDQSTQQNAAMVEETSAAARNLTSEVTLLAEQASRFNIGSDAPRITAPVAPARPAPAAKPRPAAPAVKAVPLHAAAAANGASKDDWTSF